MKRVILESPNKIDRKFFNKCVEDSLSRGEAPISLNFLCPSNSYKYIGSAICSAWSQVADCVVVYVDNGITPDMLTRIENYNKCSIKIVYRYLNATSKPVTQNDDRSIYI